MQTFTKKTWPFFNLNARKIKEKKQHKYLYILKYNCSQKIRAVFV